MKPDKKFVPEQKPFKQNRICSFYKVKDQKGKSYYAKFFIQKSLSKLNMLDATQYNQSVLSDLSDQSFPQHFLQIKYTYAIPEGFIFVTEQYSYNLQTYLGSKKILEQEALSIFRQITKAIYSLYTAGYWHRNIRPQHFVKVKDTWKLQSLVFNENIEGFDSQYLWNSAYQPPQAYQQDSFEQQQLDEMIVWNAGSILVDMLLSFHKLKDQSVLKKFIGKPFSFKDIGINKKQICSQQLQNILGHMLHHNPKKRMKYNEYFSNQFLCPQVAKIHKSKQSKQQKQSTIINKKIYVPGSSNISKSAISNQQINQKNLQIQGFNKKRQQLDQSIRQSLATNKNDKISSSQQLKNAMKKITKNNIDINYYHPITQHIKTNFQRQQKMENMLMNPKINHAIQIYKCYYDKCQLLLISIKKLQKVPFIQQQQKNKYQDQNQNLLLNNYALTFVALLNLHSLAQNMNKNLNSFNLNDQLWYQFQQSYQFKAFKDIVNNRKFQTKQSLRQIKQKIQIFKNNKNNKKYMNKEEIQIFLNCDYKEVTFDKIKGPYRKILKKSYDIISKLYNNTKSQEIASIGMYITYCMAIDKMYIPQHIEDNFSFFFDWSKIPSSSYVPLDKFQEYLDNAGRKILVKHSSHILSKYFHV